MQEEQSSLVLVLDSVEGKSVHDTKNAQKESSKLTSTQNDVNSNTEIEILGGEVSDVYILGSSNGNALIQGTTDDHDQEGDGKGEAMSSYIAEDDPKVTEEAIDITARNTAQTTSFLKSDSRNFGVSPSRNHTEVLRTKALPYKPSDEEIQIRNVANNKFTGWVPSQLKNINLQMVTRRAQALRPHLHLVKGNQIEIKARLQANSSDGCKKSGIGGAAIAGIWYLLGCGGQSLQFFLYEENPKNRPMILKRPTGLYPLIV
ncbi:hypothetical protein Tco_0084879 [Tanacetum coccineum]